MKIITIIISALSLLTVIYLEFYAVYKLGKYQMKKEKRVYFKIIKNNRL